MDTLSRTQKFRLLGPARQLLLARIWLTLATAQIALAMRGLSHFTAGLTLHRTTPVTPVVCASQLAQARELGRLVAIAARYTPWHSRCLIQVLVLQRLLERRQIPGSFSLGAYGGDVEGAKTLNAHAWLRCGDAIVNGATPGRSYTVLSTFSWGPSPTNAQPGA